MPIDWKSLLAEHGPKLALTLMAAKQGGPQAVSALMQGLEQNQQRKAAGQHQQMLDSQSQQAQTFAQQNATADNQRADEQLQRQKFQDALAMIDRTTQQQSATATDPVQAENAVMKTSALASQSAGLPPDALSPMVPNMAPAISAKEKKQASDLYASMEKVYGAEAMANDSITIQSERFGPIKPSALRAKFAAAQDATGAPALPPTPKDMRMVDLGGTKQAVDFKTLKGGETFKETPTASASAGKDANGLTPNAALEGTLKLRDRFTKETQAATTVNTQLRLMKSSLAAVKAGAAAPGSQGVLVTFQKILDPTSVVRESEYARSASGLSLISRMEGAMQKIQTGGAGVPVKDLEQFVTLAEQFVRNQAQAAETTRKQIDSIAKDFGLKPENITRELGLPTDNGADVIYARDPNGKLHEAKSGTALPTGWTLESK